MAKNGDYPIPFDDKGNQLHYPQQSWQGPMVWEPNHEWDGTIEYEGYSRGRSAAYFNFVRDNGTKITMFLKEFEDVVKLLNRGRLTGKFTFIKRGQNYGARLVSAETPDD